ncbi:CYTOCHROME P450 28A5-RELATED [Salix viminalis]|uniref:CYTOCHROME P450 28A5-RELATED n=1 Tax=Salix viminalis TaxID=40686 RepID=A0A9Q0QAC7_SALVM|nr:CYTOCHROME P450 28A5-RELATED [Salix viminalis]
MNSILKLVNDFISSESTREYAKKEFNAILWVALITITSVLLDKVFKLFRLWSKASKIPGPPCNSFFGHGNLGSRENFIDLLWESHDKYGSVFKLWLGPTQLLVSMKDPTLIKDMLLKAGDKLPCIGKAFRLAFGRSSLFFCSYDQAQKGRESLAMELDDKLLGKANVISKNVVNCIMEGVDASMSIGSVDCKLISQHMAFTILGTSLFGDTFLAWSKATFYEELLMMIAKDASFWASYRFTPFWKRGFWRYQSLCTDLKCLTLDIVQQCGKNHKLSCHMDRNYHIGTANDKFFSQELGGDINAREEPCGNIMGLMFHGCIATTSLIGSILERLVADAEIQDKIYSEIMKVKQGSVREDQDVEEMLLLLATIYESARLLPAGPLLQRCSLKDDLILKNGMLIPAGALLVVPAQLLQMDGSSWGSDASKFNPYRFLSKAVKGFDLVHDTSSTEEAADPIQCSSVLNDPNDNAAFLPFGSGMRTCVGQKFVIRGVATLFASLLEHYEVRPHPQLGNGSKSTAGPEIVFARRSR